MCKGIVRRVLSLAVALVCIFCLTACQSSHPVGQSLATSVPTDEPTDTPTQEPTDVPTKAPTAKPTVKPTKSSDSYSTSFTNKYGTPTTRCSVMGCDKYIASSGDTNCCTSHSNRCLECGCYIDGDATFCMSCLMKTLTGK